MPRITRISSSLVIVLIAYWAYALLAVPWIEPPVDLTSARQITDGGLGPNGPSDLPTRQLLSIEDLFQPDDWEIASPKRKMLQSDRAKLLLQDYQNLGGGKVEITPCTIVFDYDGPTDNEEQRHRQSIILRAPAGATLQFDRPVDLKRPSDAKLLGGLLKGEVTIHSDWKEPGPDDDLRIVTSNVRLTKQTISTPDPVAFRWGPHFGNGQDMLIKLLPGRARPGMGTSAMNVAGIESFELRHVERLHLDLGKEPEKLVGASLSNQPAATPAVSPSTPVEIRCRGLFRFDVVGRVATFNDSVIVTKANPTGDPDQIVCDLLSIFFIQRPTGKPAPVTMKTAKNAPSMDLMVERFEARGKPVVVTAPSETVTAQAQRIEYNLLSKSLSLDGDQPVFLQQGPNEIHARSLFYQSAAEEGRLGQLVSQGPGRLRGQSRDKSDQQIEAVWQDQLRMERREPYQVISLLGGAELNSPGVGHLQAKRIFLWLIETPSLLAKKKFDAHPRGLNANEDVHFGSSQLSGKVDQLEVEFREGAGLAAVFPPRTEGMGGSPPIGPSDRAAPQPITLLPPTSAAPADRPQHFEVSGRLLSACMLIQPPKPPLLTDLTIEDRVELDETQTPQPEDRPVLMRGDRVVVNNAAGTATLVGASQLARLEGRGLALTGPQINIDRGPNTNRLWIDGPGKMDVLVDKDLEGRPLPAPSTLTIDWQGGMNFDGQTATFRQSVVADTPGIPSQTEMTQFHLKTSQMDVQLQQPISFSEQKPAQKKGEQQIEKISCGGGVDMETRTFDNRQQLLSHDQMYLEDLAINRLTGALNGGPGRINRVWFGSNDVLTGQPVAPSANAPAKANQLLCLHVTYKGSITGNTLRHEVTFHDKVQIAYAPVDNWDAVLRTDDPNRLGPDGAVGGCDELRVVQMPLPTGDGRAIELGMLGNAFVEGTTFKAVGHSISYAQVKDLLTIKGVGNNPAELFRQAQPGDEVDTLRAQEIFYWPKTKNFRLIGPQMLQVQLPDGKRK